MALYRLIARQAEARPESIALLAPGRASLTYGELMRHCERVAAHLKGAGIGRGDRVAVAVPNGPEMASCFLAVSAIATCAPLNPESRANEFEHFLSQLAPAALIVEQGGESPAAEVAQSLGIQIIPMRIESGSPAGIFTLEIGSHAPAGGLETADRNAAAEAGDDALILFTSGTTARPKMVPLTQNNLAASVENIIQSMPLTALDRALNVMPLYHVSGIVGVLLATLRSGGSVVCTPGFYAPRFFEWCEEFGPTWYFGVPTMHRSVLARARENPGALSKLKLRFVRSGAAPLPSTLMRELEETLKVPVVEGYGLTETTMQVSINPLPPGVRKPGSVGIAGVTKVAVVDETGEFVPRGATGEIVIRGPAVFAGYAGEERENSAVFSDGWFHTGDQGRLDDDGYLYVTGRIKEIIIRGGQKISPREIDEALSAHPDVIEAVAFAIRDGRLGEQAAAAVVLRHSSTISEREMRSFTAGRLADYKVPARVVFVDRIPPGANGKVNRTELGAYFGLDRDEEETYQSPYAAPETATQQSLVEIWQRVLGVARVGINDHFMALGGDSLLLAQVAAKLREMGGPSISMLTFFERPTIAGLAALIDRGAMPAISSEEADARVEEESLRTRAVGEPAKADRNTSHALWPIQPHGMKPPLYVVGSFTAFVPLARRLGLEQPILGVTVPDELKLRVPYRLEEIAESEVESILRAHREGPFCLAGFSAEGVLAYEVAQQLTLRGRPPELVIMIDSACPAVSDPFVARMMRNARIHAGHVASGGLDQLRDSASGIWRRLSLRLRIRAWRMVHPLGVPINRPTPREPMDVILANVIASHEYEPKPYGGRVILFRRTEGLVGRYRLPDNGWGRVVRGGFEVVPVTGGHLELLAEPGVATVARRLEQAMGLGLDEAAEIASASK